jgi:hypothetical protein
MEIVGRAWIRNAFRPIYSIREIKRGKFKGKLEVTYRKPTQFSKIKIEKKKYS